MKTLCLVLAIGIATACPVAQAAKPSPKAAPVADTVDRTQPPQAGPLPTPHFPDPLTETLPNGLRLFVLPIHKQPMVTYRLLFKGGDFDDGGKPGLAALTAALLNKGTKELNAREFANKTDFLGIRVEAASDDDALMISASGLSRYAPQILGFLRDAALHPAFRQGEVDKEKMKAISELAQKRKQPAALSSRLCDRLIFGDHPYGASATPESVKSITRDDLVAFHQRDFVPNNATLVVVGDVDAAAMITQIKEAFGALPARPMPERKPASAFPVIDEITVHVLDRPGSVQSNIIVAGSGVAKNNPDVPELSVVNSVLGGGMSGRLFANLREKNGLTYGSYSGFSPKKLGGSFSATAQVRTAVTGKAVEEIIKELKRISSEPIPEKELELQRNYLIGNFLMSVENDQRTAERLQEIDLYGLPEDYYKTYAKKLAGLTPERASELARKYIDPEHLVIVVVGEAGQIAPQVKKFGKVTIYDEDMKPIPQTEPVKTENKK